MEDYSRVNPAPETFHCHQKTDELTFSRRQSADSDRKRKKANFPGKEAENKLK